MSTDTTNNEQSTSTTTDTEVEVKQRKQRKWSDIANERGYVLPVRLTCRITGRTVAYTSPKYIDMKIKKYGSLNKLRKNFISREGQAKLKTTVNPSNSGADVAKTTGARRRGRPPGSSKVSRKAMAKAA